MGILKLQIPKLKDLQYRKELLANEKTMSYNIGYGTFNNSGCIEFKQESWEKWFHKWINNEPKRYYAYILKADENTPIGEVALTYVEKEDGYCVSIVIDEQYRGRGFSEEVLKLILSVAFNKFKAKNVFDNFTCERQAAEKLFKKLGFKRISKDVVNLSKDRYMMEEV